MGGLVVVIVGGVVGLWCLLRAMTWRRFVKLGRSATAATVRPVDGGALHPALQPDVESLAMAGLELRTITTTTFPDQPMERTAHLVDPTCPIVVRVMCVDGHEAVGNSVSALSWYPGGFVATSRASSVALRAEEVVQTFPGASPLEVVFRQREAVEALGAQGARPLAVPTDLAAALESDWHADGAAMQALSASAQMRLSKATFTPATSTQGLAGRADLPQIAGWLALER